MAISKIGPLALTNGGGSVATNTASGTGALNSNTSGSNNTALGYQSLYSTTTAAGQTAVGYKAGYAATTGGYDAFFGFQAGQAKNTASDNFGSAFFGGSAGEAVNSGIDNSFFGGQAGRANTTGSYNTAIGTAALKSSTTANYMTAVGYKAGYAHTGGEWFSTFVGYYAGLSSTGATNCFIGGGAGQLVTTGAKNTVLGSYNGNQGGLDIRTQNNFIVMSDGDGNPRQVLNSNGYIFVGATTGIDAGNGHTFVGDFFSSFYRTRDTASNYIIAFYSNNHGTQTIASYFRADGGLANYSANNVNLSDETLKKDIELAPNYLDKLCKIPVKTYLYKTQTDTDLNLGVIAQDVQAVCPELVGTMDIGSSEEPDVKLAIYETDLKYAMLKAIQELKAEFDEYKRTHP